MVDQFLFLDVVLKTISGLFLLIIPRVAILSFGLPRSDQAFYTRLLGATLLALAAAIMLDATGTTPDGLGSVGAAIINLIGAAAISTLLMVPRPTMTLRGRFLLWGLTLALVVIGVGELLVRSV